MLAATTRFTVVALLLVAGAACGDRHDAAEAASAAGRDARAAESADSEDDGRGPLAVPAITPVAWTGDLDTMLERRHLRALVAPTRTQYWLDLGQQVGIEYELLKAFEAELNRSNATGRKNIQMHIVFVPTARDQLIPALLAGRGDIAAGVLTVTPERREQVDFGEPFSREGTEVVVTGSRSPELASLADLGGRSVFVRRSSSYWTHLQALSDRLRREGHDEIRLEAAPEELQDDDILEMLNAGLVGITVVDGYAAQLWSQVFPDLRPRVDLAVHTGSHYAWMMRKGSPKLKAAVDSFVKKNRKGSLIGNTLIKKYLGSTRFARPAISDAERAKFEKMVGLFRTYGNRYDIDYLLMSAQGYQESRLDQSARSPAGAVGVMQVMPATGVELDVGDIHQLEPNIHAGVKYVRFMIDRYYGDEPMAELDKCLFAFASYNAGPARIRKLRQEAAQRGLDPNRWFNNVELVAADRIGSETVTYVSNIFKYYIAYTLLERNREAQEAAKAGAARSGG